MTSIREAIARVRARIDRAHLAALAIVALAAVPIASAIVRFAGWQRSIWVEVVVGADRPVSPSLSVSFAPGEHLPVLWDSDVKYTILGLRAERPVQLLAIDTDRGVVPPWLAQTWAPLWSRVAN